MNTAVYPASDWYLRMLLPLNGRSKLDIINKLSASLLSSTKTKKVDSHFFDGLSNAWDDGKSPEEEVESLMQARRSGVSRQLRDFLTY